MVLFKNNKRRITSCFEKFDYYSLDVFAEPVAVNFKGKQSVGSCFGLFSTVVLFSLISVYLFSQLVKVFTKDNPNITN